MFIGRSKSHATSAALRGLRFTRGGITGLDLTAREMILAAFRVTDPQQSGGPGCLDSDSFVLEAKTESHATTPTGGKCNDRGTMEHFAGHLSTSQSVGR